MKYGLIAGVIIFFLMPDDWSNLAFSPWYVSWFIFPAFILYSMTCLIFQIDFVSDAANISLISILWFLSVVVVFIIYGLLIEKLFGLYLRDK